MNKIFLIIKREYLSRVKKKSFLVVTFLVPLLFIAMWGGIIALSIQDTVSKSTVNVIDESGLIFKNLVSTNSITFNEATGSTPEAKERLRNSENSYLLVIPKNILEKQNLELLSSQKANIFIQDEVRNQTENILRETLLKNAGIDLKTLESIQPHVKITSLEITEEGGEQESDTGIAMGIGMFSSIMIYLTLFIYGAQVMRGVIEEKNNRVVEIIISSVKPFQLMLGKIIGIGLVGLTQFLLWIVLSGALLTVGGLILSNQMPEGLSSEDLSALSSSAPSSAALAQGGFLGNIQGSIANINFPYLISCFLIFFIGGYLLYSALFAAVGSAVDNETETQQFMLPITMPLLFTYVMSFGVLIKDPHGPLAFWLSMIPFTSPIAMMVRVPFGVPFWQLALSITLLIAGFILTTWVAARIYRVGILMYGKKASYKELIKWFSYRK